MKQPPSDLVDGIKSILDATYGCRAMLVLGTLYDINLTVAVQLATILEEARLRDKELFAKELHNLASRIKR